MKLDALNPFVRYAKLHVYYAPPKTNNVCYDCRLFYLLFGDGALIADGVEYSVNQGTAIFLPPKTRYHFRFTDPGAVNIYVVDLDLTDEMSDIKESLKTATEEDFSEEKVPDTMVFDPFRRVIVMNNASRIRDFISEVVEAMLREDCLSYPLASAYIKLALIYMQKGLDEQFGEHRLAERIIEFVKENYSSFDLSNKFIAGELHYHPYYISRVVKAKTGMTLHEYITDYRIKMAENYLITTSRSVTEIAEACGFASYTHFIKLFRVRTGYSPLKYRQLHKTVGF